MKDLKIVKSILSKFYDLEQNPTFIFGSRSTKTNRDNSDLDILIEDSNIPPHLVTLLHEAFEKSPLLYKVDIILKSRIDESFYENIKSSCKRISTSLSKSKY